MIVSSKTISLAFAFLFLVKNKHWNVVEPKKEKWFWVTWKLLADCYIDCWSLIRILCHLLKHFFLPLSSLCSKKWLFWFASKKTANRLEVTLLSNSCIASFFSKVNHTSKTYKFFEVTCGLDCFFFFEVIKAFEKDLAGAFLQKGCHDSNENIFFSKVTHLSTQINVSKKLAYVWVNSVNRNRMNNRFFSQKWKLLWSFGVCGILSNP